MAFTLPPHETVDIAEMLAHVKDSRKFLDEATPLMVGEERKQFQNLLSMIDANLTAAESAVPEFFQTFENKFRDLAAQHKKNKADVAELEKQLAEIEAAEAEGKKPQLAAPPIPPVNLNLGQQLRSELLQRFAPLQKPSASDSGVAWQDWVVDDHWLPDDDQ